MKQFDPIPKTIGENEFRIYPLPAFKAANLSGNLLKTIAPAISIFMTMFADKSIKDLADTAVQDLDGEAISSAFVNLDGDAVENLLKQMLTKNKNIVIINNNYPEGTWLTEDIANEAFCLNVQDMYILAFDVLKVNYSRFFKKPINRFGDATEASTTATSANTVISMQSNSAN